MSQSPSQLFFDLDGTLTDSRPGTLNSMRHALSVLGLPIPADAALVRSLARPRNVSFPA